MPKSSSSERLQINIRMDSKPDLYKELKLKAKKLNCSMTDLIINAIEVSLGYTIPVDSIQMINKINDNEFRIKQLENKINSLLNK